MIALIGSGWLATEPPAPRGVGLKVVALAAASLAASFLAIAASANLAGFLVARIARDVAVISRGAPATKCVFAAAAGGSEPGLVYQRQRTERALRGETAAAITERKARMRPVAQRTRATAPFRPPRTPPESWTDRRCGF
jgi:hypothetical protein